MSSGLHPLEPKSKKTESEKKKKTIDIRRKSNSSRRPPPPRHRRNAKQKKICKRNRAIEDQTETAAKIMQALIKQKAHPSPNAKQSEPLNDKHDPTPTPRLQGKSKKIKKNKRQHHYPLETTKQHAQRCRPCPERGSREEQNPVKPKSGYHR